MGLGIATIAAFVAIAEGRAETTGTGPQIAPVPPLSVVTSKYFASHPAAWKQFLSELPRRPPGAPLATPRPAISAAGGTWQAVTTAPVGLSNPLLLTDGTVIAADGNTAVWYKLTPTITGSYVKGTWSKIAPLPVIGGTQYAPLYHASAVLPDGRVIIMGGEYNGTGTEVWTKLGAIYDPVANRWTAVSAPSGSGWANIGDAESVVLANGTFMLASCCGDPAVDALLTAKTLAWTKTGGPTAGQDYQDEQGYNLLPNGNVLTLDIWTNYPYANASNAEQYNPSTGTWRSAGNTPVPLGDSAQCGTWEMGPAVLRGDETLVAFGANTGCVAGKTADPTAIYNTKTGKWSAGPNVPAVCGTNKKTSCTLADAPAALLPNGNVLFAASAGFGKSPTHFFEFTKTNAIQQVADTVYYANTSTSYYYNFLVLPTGQILSTDFSAIAEVYTPVAGAVAGLAPVIATAPATVIPGMTYPITGTQFNGVSQGADYGDDVQGATNYPIVQITNVATGGVYYARTANFSTMSVAPGAAGSASFTIPAAIKAGPSKLVVIANGIASLPVNITVK